MNKKSEKAAELFQNGFNCSQAVLGAFCECYGMKTEKFIKMFKENNKSIVCRDILGCDITTSKGKEKALTEQYFTTVCLDMVVSAAQTLECLGC